jgi:type III pantothenate kinase
MLLAIDVGNTNIVFALCEGGAIVRQWRLATNPRRTADEYTVQLRQLFELDGLQRAQVTRALIASVVPQAMFELTRHVRSFFGVEPRVIGQPGACPGLRVALPDPAQVGADRLVNAAAALAIVDPPLIVIDFGTATTFDCVSADGDYIGGVICPGINLSMEALFAAAAQLPRIAVEAPTLGMPVIGTTTVHAMRSGVFYGYIGLIDGLAERITSELGGRAAVIATGGLAPLFREHCGAIGRVEPDLTIRGLMLIDERNTPT